MLENNNNAGLTPAQTELESALRAIRPACHTIDRDRLMFEAGAVSASRRVNVWRVVAAVLVVGNVVALGFALQSHHGPANVAISEKPSPAAPVLSSAEKAKPRTMTPLAWGTDLKPSEPLMPASGAGYLPVRDAVLRFGVWALPTEARTSSAGSAADIHELLDTPQRSAPATPWSSLTTPLQRLFSGEQL
jgi:hypothetical protein